MNQEKQMNLGAVQQVGLTALRAWMGTVKASGVEGVITSAPGSGILTQGPGRGASE